MSLLLALSLSTLVVYVLYRIWIRYEHFQQFKRLGIPGPRPSLVIGNLREIYRKGHLTSQQRWHRMYGPVLGYFFGYEPILLVADLDLLRSILVTDFDDFLDRPGVFDCNPTMPSLFTSQGNNWKYVRSVLVSSFTKNKLKPLFGEVLSVVDEFMDNVRDALASGVRFVNIDDLYRALTLDCLTRSILGADFGIQRDVDNSQIYLQMNSVVRTSLSAYSVVLLSFPWLRFLVSAVVVILQMFVRVTNNPLNMLRNRCMQSVKRRREDLGGDRLDVLQLMLNATVGEAEWNTSRELANLTAGGTLENSQRDDIHKLSVSTTCPLNPRRRRLHDGEIIDNAVSMLAIGYNPTASALGIITRFLARFPHVQKRLRSGLIEAMDGGKTFEFDRIENCQYLDAVIKECLRMYPPVYAFTIRRAVKDKVYENIRIPRGMNVLASVSEVHNNSDVFAEPHVFRPERFLPDACTEDMTFSWLAFGAGPRNCVGLQFVKMLIKLVLARLLTQYRFTADTEPLGDSTFSSDILTEQQRVKEPLLVQLFKL